MILGSVGARDVNLGILSVKFRVENINHSRYHQRFYFILCFWFALLYQFFNFLGGRERENAPAGMGEAEREGGRESQVGSMPSMEPDVELALMTLRL